MRSVLILLATTLILIQARPNHFGNPCLLCQCFVEYSDRDMRVPMKPYAIAADGYETTEDRCLSTCRKDERCKAAVYGMVGGRQVFTCEFYDEIDAKSNPTYAAYVNIYVKKAQCDVKAEGEDFEDVAMIEADETSVKRRTKHEKELKRPNPFHRG